MSGRKPRSGTDAATDGREVVVGAVTRAQVTCVPSSPKNRGGSADRPRVTPRALRRHPNPIDSQGALMSSRLARVAATFAAGTVVASLVAVAPAHASDPTPRHRGNPTGTAAGSLANGSANLKVSLDLTADGRVKVSWTRPAPATALKRFVVKVGPNRLLDNLVKSFKVARNKQSLIVPQAFGVLPDSGNFTFVKVFVYRKTGQVGASPTKWIEAPIASTCTAAPDDQVTVGTFNIRNWQ